MDIKDIRALTGLTQVKFSQKYGIPLRTYTNWEQKVHPCPQYILGLLEFKVKADLQQEHQ